MRYWCVEWDVIKCDVLEIQIIEFKVFDVALFLRVDCGQWAHDMYLPHLSAAPSFLPSQSDFSLRFLHL
jgi:hypothetical protein